jgi:hypothetical protein
MCGVGYRGRSAPEETMRQKLRNSTGANQLEFQAPGEPNTTGVTEWLKKACEI